MKIFSGTDTSVRYKDSTIKSILGRNKSKIKFKSNSSKESCQSNSAHSLKKNRKSDSSRKKQLFLDDANVVTDMITQDSKPKGISLPWSNYVVFMGIKNTNSPASTPESSEKLKNTLVISELSKESVKCNESKKDAHLTKNHKKRHTSDTKKPKSKNETKSRPDSLKPKRLSLTSIVSINDLINKIESSKSHSRKDKEKKRNRRAKHDKEKQSSDRNHEHKPKSTTLIRGSSSSKLDVRKIIRQTSSKSLKKHRTSSKTALKKLSSKLKSKNERKHKSDSKNVKKKSSSLSINKKTNKSCKPVIVGMTLTSETPNMHEKKNHTRDKAKLKVLKQTSDCSIQSRDEIREAHKGTYRSEFASDKGLDKLKSYQPPAQSVPRKRCKGECIGKGRIVYSEKGSNVVAINDTFVSSNKRKHMSIFNLDRYMQSDEREYTSKDSIETKTFNNTSSQLDKAFGSTVFTSHLTKFESPVKNVKEEVKCESTVNDRLAAQKISAHRNTKDKGSWGKIEADNKDALKLLRTKKSKCLKHKETGKTSSSESVTNISKNEVGKTNESTIEKIIRSESNYINKMISELVIKINLIKELLPTELISKTIQEKNIESIESTIELLKEILHQKNSHLREELLESISNMQFQGINGDENNLQALLDLSDNYIMHALEEKELLSLRSDSKVGNGNCFDYVETKSNEVQTEQQVRKNVAIQHRSRKSSNQINNSRELQICSATKTISEISQIPLMEQEYFVDKAKVTVKHNAYSESTKQVEYPLEIRTISHKLDENKNKKEKNKVQSKKRTQKRYNEKNVPLWTSTYQISDSFHCKSVEKIEAMQTNSSNSSKLVSFDMCHSTSSNNFIIRHVTKSQQFEKNIHGECKSEKCTNKTSEHNLRKLNVSSDISVIGDYVAEYYSDMSADSLISNFAHQERKHSVQCKNQETSRDKFSEKSQYDNFLGKQDSNCSFEFERYCSIATFEVPEITSVKSEFTEKSKKSDDTLHCIKSKTEGEQKNKTEKISESEDDFESESQSGTIEECDETGKDEDEIQTNSETQTSIEDASNKITEDIDLETKSKRSLTVIRSDDSLKLSVLIHCYKKHLTNTRSEDASNKLIAHENRPPQKVVSNALVNDATNLEGVNDSNSQLTDIKVFSGNSQNEKATKNGVYCFPSITIYNRSYVNSIGDWMKNYLSENSSEEKVNLSSLMSIEHDLKTIGNCSAVLSKAANSLNDAIYKSENVKISTKDDQEVQLPKNKTNWLQVSKKKQSHLNASVVYTTKVNNCPQNERIINFQNRNTFKINNKLESRIPIFVPTTANRNSTFILDKNTKANLHAQEVYNSNYTKIIPSEQSSKNNILSDISTLVSLCSSENDSTISAIKSKELKEKKPKYHLISRTYCTIDDCINVGEVKLPSIHKISNSSFDKGLLKSSQLNGILPLNSNKSLDTSTTSTIQTNSSCIDRLQSLMSSFHNKKYEKPKKRIWKNFITSLKKKENGHIEWRGSNKIDSKSNGINGGCPKNGHIKFCHHKNLNVSEKFRRKNDDVELLQSCKVEGVSRSLHASSYQTIFSKDTEVTEMGSGIEVLYPPDNIEDPRDSETFTICAPNSRFGLNHRSRSMESFFRANKDVWRTKSVSFDYDQFPEHCCSPLKKVNSSNYVVRNNKLQECYHYCKCGQLLKIEIIKNLKCVV